ncbi:MAG: DUF1731 domain-containing protein [Propionibacteriaceae bacterium]|nr:DUF1731 domain-containing protein [Propionibacteriaceae bacterium]
MKILLTGASGLIGTALLARLRPGQDCRTLTLRPPYFVPPDDVQWADAIISLNGVPLAHLPWTPGYRRQIAASRVHTTEAIAQAIAQSANPPAVWLAASAVGIYGDRGDEELTEEAAPGRGFLAEVTKAWEQATSAAADRTRVVGLRTGLVITPGLAARVGPASAWWPWVSLTDEVGAIVHALRHDRLVGPVNIVGPTPAHHPIPVPAPVLRAMLGQVADELLLASQKVIPLKLVDSGYSFVHKFVAAAIAAHDQ